MDVMLRCVGRKQRLNVPHGDGVVFDCWKLLEVLKD